MKKTLSIVLTALAVISFFAFEGCKEDSTAPKITIIGSKDTTIARNSVYIDPGATADDDKDASVYVISDFNEDNPDEGVPAIYTILYKAQDRNANLATDTRLVSVTFVGNAVAYTYSVTDTFPGVDTLAYSANVISNILNPYQVYISNLFNANAFSGSAYANLKGNTVTIPSQRPDGPFSQYIVSGSGIIMEVQQNIIWDLFYTIQDTANAAATQNRHAVFLY